MSRFPASSGILGRVSKGDEVMPNEVLAAICAIAASVNLYGCITEHQPILGAFCLFFSLLTIIIGTDHE